MIRSLPEKSCLYHFPSRNRLKIALLQEKIDAGLNYLAFLFK